MDKQLYFMGKFMRALQGEPLVTTNPLDYVAQFGTLTAKFYPEINRSQIELELFTEVNPTPSILNIVKTSSPYEREGKYQIFGILPESIREQPNMPDILDGCLAHELSHLARGDFTESKMSRLLKLFKMGVIGRIAYSLNERATDKDVIKRGLGRQLYNSTLFFEGLRDSNTSNAGYSSTQLRKILKLA